MLCLAGHLHGLQPLRQRRRRHEGRTKGRREATSVGAAEVRARVITLIVDLRDLDSCSGSRSTRCFYTFTFWARDNTATLACRLSTFQSVEPLGVIVLSPVLVASGRGCSAADASRRRPSKMLLGVAARRRRVRGCSAMPALLGGDTGRVSPLWLIAANLIIALGEIALSPMGMSLVNRLAPPRLRGLMMGGWFVSLGARRLPRRARRRATGTDAAQPVLPASWSPS